MGFDARSLPQAVGYDCMSAGSASCGGSWSREWPAGLEHSQRQPPRSSFECWWCGVNKKRPRPVATEPRKITPSVDGRAAGWRPMRRQHSGDKMKKDIQQPKRAVDVGSTRLVRLRPGGSYLDFAPTILCRCGGPLQVRDWRGPCVTAKAAREWRYEVFCQRCQRCDPNGYRTQEQVLSHGPRYFSSNGR